MNKKLVKPGMYVVWQTKKGRPVYYGKVLRRAITLKHSGKYWVVRVNEKNKTVNCRYFKPMTFWEKIKFWLGII